MIKWTDYLLQDFKVISQSISQISNSSDFLKIERNFCSDSSFESPLTHTIRRWWTLRNIQVIIIKPPGHPIWEWKLKLNWIDLGPSQKHLKIRSSLMTFNFKNFAFHIDSADSTRHNYSQQPQTTFDFFAWKTTFHNLFFWRLRWWRSLSKDIGEALSAILVSENFSNTSQAFGKKRRRKKLHRNHRRYDMKQSHYHLQHTFEGGNRFLPLHDSTILRSVRKCPRRFGIDKAKKCPTSCRYAISNRFSRSKLFFFCFIQSTRHVNWYFAKRQQQLKLASPYQHGDHLPI